jgi:hypothetical protein
MRSRLEGSQQKADIFVGSELSIGKVVKIRHEGVDVKNNGNEFFVSRTAIEKVFADDQNTQTNR